MVDLKCAADSFYVCVFCVQLVNRAWYYLSVLISVQSVGTLTASGCHGCFFSVPFHLQVCLMAPDIFGSSWHSSYTDRQKWARSPWQLFWLRLNGCSMLENKEERLEWYNLILILFYFLCLVSRFSQEVFSHMCVAVVFCWVVDWSFVLQYSDEKLASGSRFDMSHAVDHGWFLCLHEEAPSFSRNGSG